MKNGMPTPFFFGCEREGGGAHNTLFAVCSDEYAGDECVQVHSICVQAAGMCEYLQMWLKNMCGYM